MTPHKQFITHDPENGQFGDCFRTAIACILDTDPLFVPHAGKNGEAGWVEGCKEVDEWLKSRHNAYLVSFKWRATEIEEALQTVQYHLMGGRSAIGGHYTVGYAGKMVHNPSKNPDAVFGPDEDGCYTVTFIVKGAGPHG